VHNSPAGAAVIIRALMRQRDVSQTDLARELGLTQSAVSDRLRGRTPLREPELRAIADFLAVPVEQLLEAPAPTLAEVAS